MRIKTDERRQAIIDAAITVFREQGFERASMANISTRVGGSKATLYSYFKSKEELFAAAMTEALDQQVQPIIERLALLDKDPVSLLREFGVAYLKLLCLPDSLAITRTAVGEGSNGSLGALLYQSGPKRALDVIVELLTGLASHTPTAIADPATAALHLKGLLDAGFLEPLLFGAEPHLAIEEAVAAAVDVFAAAYLPKRPPDTA